MAFAFYSLLKYKTQKKKTKIINLAFVENVRDHVADFSLF